MSGNLDNVWINFKGCICLKSLLIESGYDSQPSLKCINDTLLLELEENIEKNRWMLEKLSCVHAKSYQTMRTFKFLPGHVVLLLDWCKNIDKNDLQNPNTTSTIEHPAFSTLLKEMLSNGISNYGKTPNSHRFTQVLMDFSIYIYIMAGKACYDVLCANFPLPKTVTIRMLLFEFFLLFPRLF